MDVDVDVDVLHIHLHLHLHHYIVTSPYTNTIYFTIYFTIYKGMQEADFKRIMAVDKKVLDGQLRLILLQGPLGGCVVTGDFSPALFEETLSHFCHDAETQ